MTIVLEGRAAPEAVGALLMLWRYRSENGDEIAGDCAGNAGAHPRVARAGTRSRLAVLCAGKSRGLPWFLLAAKLTASAGTGLCCTG